MVSTAHPADPKISFRLATTDDLVTVTNLYSLYLHDMAEWFQFDPGTGGAYEFDLAVYAEASTYLLLLDDRLAGFAIAGAADKWISSGDALELLEFFVLRAFRHRGHSSRFAEAIWSLTPGAWLTRVYQRNLPALRFWGKTIETYTGGKFLKDPRIIDGAPWMFYRFDSSQLQSADQTTP